MLAQMVSKFSIRHAELRLTKSQLVP